MKQVKDTIIFLYISNGHILLHCQLLLLTMAANEKRRHLQDMANLQFTINVNSFIHFRSGM